MSGASEGTLSCDKIKSLVTQKKYNFFKLDSQNHIQCNCAVWNWEINQK